MIAPKYIDLKEHYEELISHMEIKPDWQARVDSMARRIIAGKSRYKALGDSLENHVPWQFIGVIHALEADLNWSTHLHNGDSLNARTRHVPAGRPVGGEPPFTWEESARDALIQKSFEKISEWPLSRCAFELERYNGWGYKFKGVPSPYLWSGSNNYSHGKYVSDGVYDPNHVSRQIGAMVILMRILALDVSSEKISEGSRKVTLLRRIKSTLTALFGSYFSLDYFGAIPEYVQKFTALGLSKQAWIAIGLGVIGWITFSVIEQMQVQDYAKGNYTPSKKPENELHEDLTI